ncbi:prepilin-type N-terminal cleavage/methylation domain-containing protein [uncultured Ilyobacter sp.]|uniref:type II secretion system protein n=1 Tax=uncultured Ilyobacter sp. TaxID=544433 RepID=UPI0029C8B8F5|nr:prepilin-type N-terminal cleavage/methylation domain-containing protein [uncultured Ilyobacter sp.]
MKKKGFTLIELVVVVAIILLLAATLAPKLRKEVAKARDAKAVAALGSIRTAVNVMYTDTGLAPLGLAGTDKTRYVFDDAAGTSEYVEKDLIKYLDDNSTNATSATGTDDVVLAPIGGFRGTSGGDVTYGGYGTYKYTATDLYVELVGADASAAATTTQNWDTKNNKWIDY